MSTRMYFAFSHTPESGFKIGDTIVASHVVRLWCENEPHDEYFLSLNPQGPLNFCFDKVVKDHNIQILHDSWEPGDLRHINRIMGDRRAQRLVHDYTFTTYKELYRRVDGGPKQRDLCGSEKGLGRKNIHEYYYFGQESSNDVCHGSDRFGAYSLGFTRFTTAPPRSVFVAPHAHSQENKVFTLEFWRTVIDRLLLSGMIVTVCSPNEGYFGRHPALTYYFQKECNMRELFDRVGQQQLVLCGNTGIGWIAGAYGVPVIVGQPRFFWFLDYRYDQCGMESLFDIFGTTSGPADSTDRDESKWPKADPQEAVDMVIKFWEKHQ